MTGPRAFAPPQAILDALEPELHDPAVRSQSPTTDRRTLPQCAEIDATQIKVAEPTHHTKVEICTPDLGTDCANGIPMQAAEHVVRFYETDAFLLDEVATFCADAILADGAALVVATPEHRAGIVERLQSRGLLDAAGTHNAHHSLDAAETLSRFMVDSEVDAERFFEVIGDAIARAAEGGRHVRVFGEMVALLVADGQPAAALRLEELWNGLQAHPAYAFSLFCAYPLDHFGGEVHQELFTDICVAHSQVIPAESYVALPTPSDRLRAIAELQRKARSLETEIAERQQAEERLRRALAAEQEAHLATEAALQVRDEFLSIAAHELRNPLAGLSLHAQVALHRLSHHEHPDPAQAERSLQSICEQVTRLTRLLDRLLDVSQLKADHLALQRRQTDVTRLVEQVVSSTRAWTDRHSIALETPTSLQAWIDPLRLEQVLANLLDNAIKHSPHGASIVVTLSQPVPGTLELAVSDRGVGIPVEARERIFDRFFQAHPEDATQGLGLGLYVSRQIVELHGGEMQANFPTDGGTRFVVTLPTRVEALSISHAAD